MRYEGVKVWEKLLREKERSWANDVERFAEAPLSITHEPKFTIDPNANFFCIGSCFARNVEEYLIYNGVKVSSRRLRAVKEESPTRCPNGLVNKFTTASMLNELRWAANPPKDLDILFTRASETTVDDLQLHPGIKSVPLERARERRRDLIENYFQQAFHADVVVLTLGLDEAWFDAESGIHLNATPSMWACRRSPSRYFLDVLDSNENLSALHEIRSILKTKNSNVKIIVTVSPVPLGHSSSVRDVAVASSRSKAALRSAAQSFADAYDDVDYFPSYEMVMFAPRSLAFDPDCLHVSDLTVGSVIRNFIKLYMGRECVQDHGFIDAHYMEANPDVAEAVWAGHFESGYHHWIQHGRAEGRSLKLGT